MMHTKEITLPYGGSGMPLAIPSANLNAILESDSTICVNSDPIEAITEAIDTPICSVPLQELSRDHQSAVIICDDITRPTPAALALPLVLARLEKAGIDRDEILIMMALGTHRPMSQSEMASKVGKEILAKYHVVNSNFWDEDGLQDLGEVNGVPLFVDRRVIAADLKISIGTVLPHPAAGWGGGGKMICPGVASERTVKALHYLQGATARNLFGDVNSPVRAAIEEWAGVVGLNFTINLVLTDQGKVYKVSAGHYISAHRQAVCYAQEIMGITFKERADIVIIDSHPADLDLWQATKALMAGDIAAKDGGTVVLVTPCPEGVGPHKELPDYIGAEDVNRLLGDIRSGRINEPIAASGAASLVRMAERVRFAIVSAGIDEKTANKMRWQKYYSAQSALDSLLRVYGADARVIVIPKGAETLPIWK